MKQQEQKPTFVVSFSWALRGSVEWKYFNRPKQLEQSMVTLRLMISWWKTCFGY